MELVKNNIYIYILISAVVSTLIRVLPTTLIRKQITNTFVKSFLYYVPYAVLASLTFPGIFYSTESMLAATVGTLIALLLSFFERSLIVVAIGAVLGVFVVGLF